ESILRMNSTFAELSTYSAMITCDYGCLKPSLSVLRREHGAPKGSSGKLTPGIMIISMELMDCS
ncbi:hypothetical protein A2U01_0107220, partial [Trifolium medium]|nr:hypothetical protein [Trifolium medium]